MRRLMQCVLVWCGLMAGCGSDSSSAAAADQCGVVSACGGNIVGTWHMTSFCVGSVPNSFGSCSGARMDVSVSGDETLELRADGTETTTTNLVMQQDMSVPADCLQGATCTQLQAALVAEVPGTVCTQVGGGCDCRTSQPIAASAPGTYTTSGSTFTIQPTGSGSSVSYTYCVTGNTLTLRTTVPNGMTMTMVGTK